MELDKGLVSIIIPSHNHADFLGEAIESCLNQTYKNIEIIVVCDGCMDSYRIARKYSENHWQCYSLYQSNKGLSSARNKGISFSLGKYILTLDADDRIEHTFIEKTIGLSDIVSTSIRYFGTMDFIKHPIKPNPTYADFYKHNHINCCSLFKREIWDKIGGYDENMKLGLEDWDFWLRATKEGYTVSVVPEPLFNYRKHVGGSMIDIARKHYRETEKYIKSKHDGRKTI